MSLIRKAGSSVSGAPSMGSRSRSVAGASVRVRRVLVILTYNSKEERNLDTPEAEDLQKVLYGMRQGRRGILPTSSLVPEIEAEIARREYLDE